MRKTILFFVLLSLTTCLLGQDNFLTALRYIKVGNTLREAQSFEQAESYLEKGLQMVQSSLGTNARYWEAVAYEYLALLYREQNENTESIRNFNKALNIYRTNGFAVSAKAINILLGGVQEAEELYGGIDVGAKGVKLSIIALSFSKAGIYKFNILKKQTIDPGTATGTDPAFKETAAAISVLVDTLKKRGIPEDRIFVVLSSGLHQALVNMKPSRFETLRKVLEDNVTNYSKEIPTITPEEEAKLVGLGVLPSRFKYNSLAIDIGSGNTKGGYFTKNREFVTFSFPYGTITMKSAITEFSAESNTRFADAAAPFYESKVKPIIHPELGRKPGFKNRQNIYLMGGIVWAMITYMHPEKIGDEFVKFTLADVQKFNRLARENYEGLTNPELGGITDLELRSRAESDIRDVKDKTFNQEDIIAGGILLEKIMTEIDKAQPQKFYYFPRYGVVGWITGYIITSIGAEIDSKKE